MPLVGTIKHVGGRAVVPETPSHQPPCNVKLAIPSRSSSTIMKQLPANPTIAAYPAIASRVRRCDHLAKRSERPDPFARSRRKRWSPWHEGSQTPGPRASGISQRGGHGGQQRPAPTSRSGGWPPPPPPVRAMVAREAGCAGGPRAGAGPVYPRVTRPQRRKGKKPVRQWSPVSGLSCDCDCDSVTDRMTGFKFCGDFSKVVLPTCEATSSSRAVLSISTDGA